MIYIVCVYNYSQCSCIIIVMNWACTCLAQP